MKKLLLGFLALNAVLQLVVSLILLLAPRTALPAMFHVAYTLDTRLLAAALGVAVFISALLLATAARWLHRGDVKGLQLAALFGLWSTFAGVVNLVTSGEAGALFDVGRGVVLLALVIACRPALRRARNPTL